MWHHRVLSAIVLAGGTFLLGAACGSRTTVSTEPSLKTFDDEARQIMTADEAEVFKSLPDEASRAEFIREFWAVRDPKPETPENEARIEFEKRVRYAALWFGAHNPYKGNDPGGPLKNLAGLNDERGRTYILLGQPDVIIFFDGSHETESRDGSRSRLQFDLWILEQWIYDRLNTYVIFRRDDGGEWYTDSFQSNFFDRLEWAKLNWSQDEAGPGINAWFKFSAKYGPSGIEVRLPVGRVSTDDLFQVELGVEVNVFRDNIKVDEIRETKTMKETQANLFGGEDLRFVIPYAPGAKGEYIFDIVIRDLKALMPSKYRVLLKRSL